MCSRVFIFLIGAVYIYYQVLAEDIYVAELMVESNVTLDSNTVLSSLNATDITVTQSGVDYKVTLTSAELVAECLIIGDDTSCNCSSGYVWSNEVCYSFNCCRETTCKGNVSNITPLCVAKVHVHINGSITGLTAWDSTKTELLTKAFDGLNAVKYVNLTRQTTTPPITVEFEAPVSVKLNTSVLRSVVTQLKTQFGDEVFVDTLGMVTITAPETTVCYGSTPKLNCTFEEATDKAGWNMTRKNERFELNTGSVVQVDSTCTTEELVQYKSCVKVTLKNVTGIWTGVYECGFSIGSVRHTARAQMNVALLPDVITMKINPLTVACPNTGVNVTATIPYTTEKYEVTCYKCHDLSLTNKTDYIVYSFKFDVTCVKQVDGQSTNITFKNREQQSKSAQVDIPVIYAGASACDEEKGDVVTWPKTPAGNTVIIQTCPEGRTGHLSRTCNSDSKWQSVFSSCINIELNKVVDAAENFFKGLGASEEVALNIFEGLKNSSESSSGGDGESADVSASINVLNTMASASNNIQLSENVFPNLVNAASNMLKSNWTDVNDTVRYKMSSTYLESVENLVKNVKVNNSNGFNSTNLDLRFCSSSSCNVSVFDIDVSLENTTGLVKTVAVKNLMEKLKNNFPKTDRTPLVLSATMQNSSNSSLEIKLNFPNFLPNTTAHCVFWDTSRNEWSEEGCFANQTEENYTLCECNHLTSFSVLMSRSEVPSPELDIITYIGLGVSVCSLLIFLTIEFIVWSAVVKTNLSHFRHTALVNIATFLLLADVCFLASASPEKLSETLCLAFTVCKHLFFLAKFCWMLCLSVMLVHQLIFVFSPLRKRVFMFLSAIVGYVFPILIVGSSYVYYRYTDKRYYDEKSCWLVYERLLVGSIHAFILPVGTVILTNLFSMVVVIVTLLKSSVPDNSKADDKETAKSIIKVVVFLTPVFGVTWVIGFFLLTMNEDDPMRIVVTYTFTILNSFQGFFILITGCLAETKVREELFKLIMAKSKGKSESTKNLTSTMYTKDK